MRYNKAPLYLLIAIVFLSLTGCGWWKEYWQRPERVRGTPESLYQRGIEAYRDGRYKVAVEVFQRLKEEHPLHQLAPFAELGIADAHFSKEEYLEAEIAYNEFINRRPTNENVPYAMYQLGMSYYNQMNSIDRDQTETRKARKEFERLITRFPDSKFAVMAEQKLKECKQRLGEHEFYVGNFYFRTGQYKAALRRFETVNRNYANLGLDYKVAYFLGETKMRLAKEEAEKAAKAAKAAKAGKK